MHVVTVVIEGLVGRTARTYGPYDSAEQAEAARRRLWLEHIMPLYPAAQRTSFTIASEVQEEQR